MGEATLSQFAGSLPCFKSLGRKRMERLQMYIHFIRKEELLNNITQSNHLVSKLHSKLLMVLIDLWNIYNSQSKISIWSKID